MQDKERAMFDEKELNPELTWEYITDYLNSELGQDFSKHHYKRLYYKYRDLKHTTKNDYTQDNETIDDKLLELKKLRVKVSDERIQANAYVRRIAREETLKEIALETAEYMSTHCPITFTKPPSFGGGSKEAILQISDWHYGLDFTNYWNTYNPEICKERVNALYYEVINKCRKNNVTTLHVVNLSDLIAGRIHLGLRLESRVDVVTQTMEVAEILAQLLTRLASEFKQVHYYDCIDNHSRVEPIKTDSINLESFARFITWYLSPRLNAANISNVFIHGNDLGEDIITFKCGNFRVLGVHGDKDNVRTIVEKMNNFTKEHFDLILSAHLHHFSADETCETVVVSNGSLMGTDTYAKNLRLNSKPSQNLIICSDTNPVECIYRIQLD